MFRHRHIFTVMMIALLGGLQGCLPTYVNEPLENFDPQGGYRLQNLKLSDKNTDSLFVVVTFSGGGTRAAALSYGVLQGLRNVELPPGPSGEPRTLLDEVDAISSVSGGSFTALAYGLWGEDMFDGHFEQRFLRHNIQGDLVLMGLNPLNLLNNKSELAARYYDKHIFKKATYGDLIAKGERPMLAVNASDMSRQEQFNFTQKTFDMMGSDLSKLPVAWAAASSSAFPILLDPLRYKYHHGAAMDAAVRKELNEETVLDHPRFKLWALSLIDRAAYEASGEIDFDEADHKYMYLLDGGVVDNLGIMPFFMHLNGGVIRKLLEADKIDRILVVLVDAGTAPGNTIERSAATPGKLASGANTATSGIHTNTWLMKAVVDQVLLKAYPYINECYTTYAPGQAHQVPPQFMADIYAADIAFESLDDYDRRRIFQTLPTTFVLNDEQVDELITVGQELVADNSEIKRLIRDLQTGQ